MISTKVFSLSAGTGACHAPVFAGRGKGMIVVSGKDLSFRKAHYRGFSLLKSISDGVVFCHLIFQGKLYFRVYHISKRGEQFTYPICPETGHRGTDKKAFAERVATE